MDKIKEQANFFCDMTKQINGIYEDYAKSVGLSFTSLYTLHMIALTDNCTQKFISEQLFLPKQTINSVVSLFCKQGLVELIELSEDRRHKTLHLTEKGQEYAASVLPKIETAEQRCIEQFTENEREILLKLLKKYVDMFANELSR